MACRLRGRRQGLLVRTVWLDSLTPDNHFPAEDWAGTLESFTAGSGRAHEIVGGILQCGDHRQRYFASRGLAAEIRAMIGFVRYDCFNGRQEPGRSLLLTKLIEQEKRRYQKVSAANPILIRSIFWNTRSIYVLVTFVSLRPHRACRHWWSVPGVETL